MFGLARLKTVRRRGEGAGLMISGRIGAAGFMLSLGAAWAAHAAQTPPAAGKAAPVVVPVLPGPDPDPMRVDPAADPILRLARTQASREAFRATVAAAVARHPGTREYQAMTEEARQVVAE